jgi:hypothetical protein
MTPKQKMQLLKNIEFSTRKHIITSFEEFPEPLQADILQVIKVLSGYDEKTPLRDCIKREEQKNFSQDEAALRIQLRETILTKLIQLAELSKNDNDPIHYKQHPYTLLTRIVIECVLFAKLSAYPINLAVSYFTLNSFIFYARFIKNKSWLSQLFCIPKNQTLHTNTVTHLNLALFSEAFEKVYSKLDDIKKKQAKRDTVRLIAGCLLLHYECYALKYCLKLIDTEINDLRWLNVQMLVAMEFMSFFIFKNWLACRPLVLIGHELLTEHSLAESTQLKKERIERAELMKRLQGGNDTIPLEDTIKIQLVAAMKRKLDPSFIGTPESNIQRFLLFTNGYKHQVSPDSSASVLPKNANKKQCEPLSGNQRVAKQNPPPVPSSVKAVIQQPNADLQQMLVLKNNYKHIIDNQLSHTAIHYYASLQLFAIEQLITLLTGKYGAQSRKDYFSECMKLNELYAKNTDISIMPSEDAKILQKLLGQHTCLLQDIAKKNNQYKNILKDFYPPLHLPTLDTCRLKIMALANTLYREKTLFLYEAGTALVWPNLAADIDYVIYSAEDYMPWVEACIKATFAHAKKKRFHDPENEDAVMFEQYQVLATQNDKALDITVYCKGRRKNDGLNGRMLNVASGLKNVLTGQSTFLDNVPHQIAAKNVCITDPDKMSRFLEGKCSTHEARRLHFFILKTLFKAKYKGWSIDGSLVDYKNKLIAPNNSFSIHPLLERLFEESEVNDFTSWLWEELLEPALHALAKKHNANFSITKEYLDSHLWDEEIFPSYLPHRKKSLSLLLLGVLSDTTTNFTGFLMDKKFANGGYQAETNDWVIVQAALRKVDEGEVDSLNLVGITRQGITQLGPIYDACRELIIKVQKTQSSI